MKTGLTKRQKTTCIYFDEASKTVEIQTHNTALKKRLARYAAKHTDLCRQTDDDEQGGLTFAIGFPVTGSTPAVYRPSQRPSLRLRMLPSPFARFFAICVPLSVLVTQTTTTEKQ